MPQPDPDIDAIKARLAQVPEGGWNPDLTDLEAVVTALERSEAEVERLRAAWESIDFTDRRACGFPDPRDSCEECTCGWQRTTGLLDALHPTEPGTDD